LDNETVKRISDITMHINKTETVRSYRGLLLHDLGAPKRHLCPRERVAD
jgi:hypothetical protein